MSRPIRTAGMLGLVLLLTAILVWVTVYWNPERRQVHQELNIRSAPKGGDFELTSYRGPISLKQLRGKVVALYFGYTQCPDICPTSLGYLSLALGQLSPEEIAGFQGLFISVDPERDSLQRLKDYGEYFNPAILGITGSVEKIDDVVRLYGAAYRKTESDSQMGYIVDHSADTYLIDRQGKLSAVMPHGTAPADMVAELRKLLKEE